MPHDPFEPSPHLSDPWRDQERQRQQREQEARRAAAEFRQQQRARFDAITAKLMDRTEALLDRLPSTQQAPRDSAPLPLAQARRQLAHIVRAPHICSRKLCRRTKACCGEPKQCLSMFLPLLPPGKIAELLLDARKTRRGRAG